MGFVVALMVRADPTPPVIRAGLESAASARPSPVTATAPADATILPTPPVAPVGSLEAEASASAARHDPAAKPPATHAPAAATTDKPKPRATSVSTKAFDLGY